MATDHNVTELKKIEKKLDRVIALLACLVNNMQVTGEADANPDLVSPAGASDVVTRFKNGSYIQYERGQVPGVIKTYGVSRNGETADGTQ